VGKAGVGAYRSTRPTSPVDHAAVRVSQRDGADGRLPILLYHEPVKPAAGASVERPVVR
jgi:hypothetical protein